MRLNVKLLGALAVLALTAFMAQAQVIVSSKIDTAGSVLGNIILEVLKANQIPVTEEIQLGATPVVREAITAGQIDIYPNIPATARFSSTGPTSQSGTMRSRAIMRPRSSITM